MKAILLTSTFRRHQFVANHLARHLDLRGVWQEVKTFVPERYAESPDDEQVIRAHFDARDASEAEYFADHDTVGIREGATCRAVGPGGCSTPEEVDVMRALEPDVVLVFGTGILKGQVLDAFHGRMINIHLGLSPYYRGAGTNFWPLVNREPEYVGATIHYIDAGIDTGPIIAHARPELLPTDGPHDIGNRAIVAAADALIHAARAHMSGAIAAVPQTGGGRLYQRKDFSADAVRRLYRNFETGMIPEYLAARVARDAAITLVEPRTRRMTTVVFYHYVRDVERTPFPGIRALSTAGFAAQLDWLQARFDLVSGPAFEQAVAARTPFDRPSALLTFDDGFVDHYEAAFPMLRQRGAGGMFFIAGSTLGPKPRLLNVHKAHFLLSRLGSEALLAAVRREIEVGVGVHAHGAEGRVGTYRYDESPDAVIKRLLNYELPFDVADAVLDDLFRQHVGDPEAFARDLYLSADQIREMAAGGMTFGFHTETHRVLSRLSADEQRAELADGVRMVRELTGQQTVPFCYPYGFTHTYNADTLRILADAGYSVAFNTVRRNARPDADPRFEIPRFDTRDVPPLGNAV